MGKNKLLVFLFIVIIKNVWSLYYACPPPSVCVPSKNCNSANVTFNAVTDKDQENQYVCGLLAQCEDNICCNDPIDLPSNFEPNKTNWCYLEEPVVDSLKMDVQIYPYQGLEEPNSKEILYHVTTLCPGGSICVTGSVCPLQYITYSFGFSGNEFTCGNHSGSIGNVCCSYAGVFDPIMKVPDIKIRFMKSSDDAVTSYDSKWSFMDSDFYADNDVKVRKQEVYKAVSGRSTKPQEWICGRTLSIANELNRIYAPVGDREAKEGDYPWHVAILSSSYEYLCSGSIIGEKTVLTIAHCFDKHSSVDNILVRVGDLNLQLDTEKNPAFDVRVKHLIIHPKYNKINLDADIAIIEMEESVRSLPQVKPVCLPQKGFSPVINQCKVPGWGQFSKSKEEKNEFNYALRAASFYIIGNSQCQNSLRKVKELGAFFKLQKRVLCAKGYSNADTCRGDGGSGLACRDKDVYVLKGLVSYGFGCGLDLPGVYTDVEKYLDFIKSYKKFIPTSSGQKVSSEDFTNQYIEKKLYTSEKEKYATDVEENLYPLKKQKYEPVAEFPDKFPTYITVQEATDQYINESPDKVLYNDNQYVEIPDKYEPLKRDEYTYIKPQKPEYVEKPQFIPNIYKPEKIEIYTQSSKQKDEVPLNYEENYFPDSSYEFSNSNPNGKEYEPKKVTYNNDQRPFENTYETSYTQNDYSGNTDERDYDTSYIYEPKPSYDQLYDTFPNFGYDDDELSYQPDYTRPSPDSVAYRPDSLGYQTDYIGPNKYPQYQPDYIVSNEDALAYQPDYTGPNEDKLSYQRDYTGPEDALSYHRDYTGPLDSLSYQSDYTGPLDSLSYQSDYTGPKKDTLSYHRDYTGPEDTRSYQRDYTVPEDTLSYQRDYTGPEDTLSYQPDYTGPEDTLSYQPDYTVPKDTLSYQSDYTRPLDSLSYQSDYTGPLDSLSYQSDYTGPKDKFSYKPDYTGSKDTLSHQPDYAGPNEDSLSYQLDYTGTSRDILYQPDYEEPSFDYRPVDNYAKDSYNDPKEIYKGTSGPTNDYSPSRNDDIYYEDFDHFGYGKGFKSSSQISPKNANVKIHSKKASGKAPGGFPNILSSFSSSYLPSVKEGKVRSPLALLRKKN